MALHGFRGDFKYAVIPPDRQHINKYLDGTEAHNLSKRHTVSAMINVTSDQNWPRDCCLKCLSINTGDIFLPICLFHKAPAPFLGYCSSAFMSHFAALLNRNHLNQFCSSAQHPLNETLQQQIPPRATQNHLTACITVKLCKPLLRHGIWRNKQLIITCENAFLSAFLSVRRMTFRAVWKEGGAIRLNYRLLPLSVKSCWWLWHGGVIPPPSLIHTHTVSYKMTPSTKGYNYHCMLGRQVLDVNETE